LPRQNSLAKNFPGAGNVEQLFNKLFNRGADHKKPSASCADRQRASSSSKWGGASRLLKDMGDTVIAVAISRDEQTFACGGANKKVGVFSCFSGDEECMLQTNAGATT
jgi:hypothetical protein